MMPVEISTFLMACSGDAALVPVVLDSGETTYAPLGTLPDGHPQRARIGVPDAR